MAVYISATSGLLCIKKDTDHKNLYGLPILNSDPSHLRGHFFPLSCCLLLTGYFFCFLRLPVKLGEVLCEVSGRTFSQLLQATSPFQYRTELVVTHDKLGAQ